MHSAAARLDFAHAERRREPRFTCRIECMASSIAGWFPITINDVSESGYGFTSKTVLPHTIQIAVKLESGPLEGAVGVVRWLDGENFGVEFNKEHKGARQVSTLIAKLVSGSSRFAPAG